MSSPLATSTPKDRAINTVTFKNGSITMAGREACSLWHSADLYAKAPGPRTSS